MMDSNTTDSSSIDEIVNISPKSSHRSYTSQVSRPKSDLSRIISGIRDDIQQQYPNDEFINAESVLANQFTNTNPEPKAIDDIQSHDDTQSESQLQSDLIQNSDKERPVDKGYAWVIAIVCMLAMFSTWGPNSAYGVLLEHYTNNNTFANADIYDYALIGSIDIGLAQSLAPLTTIMYQFLGLRFTVGLGLVLQTLGYILASFATKLWQLYLTQGLLIGISFCLIYIPPTLVLPTWFEKYKAFAFGIAVAGSGLGGVVCSLCTNRMIQITGDHRWALRVLAIIALVAGIPALFLQTRTKPPKRSVSWPALKHNAKLIFDVSVLKSTPIILLMLWFGVAILGYIVMLYSLSSYATSVGLSSKQASNLTAIINGGQVIGRPLMGLTADMFGRANFGIVVCLTLTIFLLAFWINAVTYAALIPFSLIIGSVVAIGSCLAQAIARDLIKTPNHLPATWSYMNSATGLIAFGAEVIALSLKKNNAKRPFLYCQIFTGCVFFFLAVLMAVIRSFLVSKALTARLAYNRESLKDIVEPKRYLNVKDLDHQDVEVIQQRIERYEYLLRNGVYYFIIRMVYPLKV